MVTRSHLAATTSNKRLQMARPLLLQATLVLLRPHPPLLLLELPLVVVVAKDPDRTASVDCTRMSRVNQAEAALPPCLVLRHHLLPRLRLRQWSTPSMATRSHLAAATSNKRLQMARPLLP